MWSFPMRLLAIPLIAVPQPCHITVGVVGMVALEAAEGVATLVIALVWWSICVVMEWSVWNTYLATPE